MSRNWLIFIGLALSVMMVDIDVTAINLIISPMLKELNMSVFTGQWIVDGYLISAAAFMAIGGRLADLKGPKKIFILGAAVFAVSSLCVALSGSSLMLILARLFQGGSIAFTFPVSLVIIRFAFPEPKQPFAVSLMVAIAGLSQALGPTVGAFIYHYLGWRWLFLLNIPLSFISLLLISIFFKARPLAPASRKIHIPSALVLIAALYFLIIGLNQLSSNSQEGLKAWWSISLGVVLAGSFLRAEWMLANPLLGLRSFVNKSIAVLNGVRFLLNIVYFSLLFTLGFLLQGNLEFSTLESGVIMLALTLVIGVISIASGKMMSRDNIPAFIKSGIAIAFFGCVLLGLSQLTHLAILLIIALVVTGIGVGVFIPSSGTGALLSVEPGKAGASMGLFFTSGFIGSAAGVALSGLLYTKHGFVVTMGVMAGVCLLAFIISFSFSFKESELTPQ